ncbi:unnamed protein product [Effrenium voratum]|uniref:Trichohyalin-plectin-homology domain-containing protein n=1 Tax=Effrenium voratum TaxID=2562239 RepID=A0AA36HUI2_9DINO|nr:unnamed protein product [Effrenium voratum]CAJ1420839.1 unnamed protein product [Effrenium voratum]
MVQLKAAQALRTALVNQFGESARGTVEEEVGRYLGRSQLVREDLDSIERNILEKVQRRRQVRSASAPRGISGSKPQPTALAGLTLVSDSPDSTDPTLPPHMQLAMVPKPLLLKPPDCFDLWREYDSIQHAKEQMEAKRRRQEQEKRYREALDEQVHNAKFRQNGKAAEKQQDRDVVLAQVEREQADVAKEQIKKVQAKAVQKQASLQFLARAEKQKLAAAQRAQAEQAAMDQTLQREGQYRQQDFERRQQHKQEESALMRQQFEHAQRLQQQAKQHEKEEDVRRAAEWAQLAPQASKRPKRTPAPISRMAEAAVEQQKAKEAALDQLIESNCRAHTQKQLDSFFAQKEERARRTRDMYAAIKQQAESNRKGEDRADLWQAEVWRESAEAAAAADRDKKLAKRAARKEVDACLFDAMMRRAGAHKSEKGIGDHVRERELLLNRPLVQRMVNHEFRTDHTEPMLKKALTAKQLQVSARNPSE